MPWLIRHSAQVINRYRVGEDGKTNWERIKGKKFKREVPEFEECVWFVRPGSHKDSGNKFEVKWEDGVWLGVRDESGEHAIGTAKGVSKASTIRRKGFQGERWNKEEILGVNGTPWEPVPGQGDNEPTSNIRLPGEREPVLTPDDGEPREFKARRLYIRPELRLYKRVPRVPGGDPGN